MPCDVHAMSCNVNAMSCYVNAMSCDVDAMPCHVNAISCNVNAKSCDVGVVSYVKGHACAMNSCRCSGPPTASPWVRAPEYCGCQPGPTGVSPWPGCHDDREPARCCADAVLVVPAMCCLVCWDNWYFLLTETLKINIRENVTPTANRLITKKYIYAKKANAIN